MLACGRRPNRAAPRKSLVKERMQSGWRARDFLLPIVLLVSLAPLPSAAGDLPACVGDCNADARVSVHELIVAVNVALELRPITRCLAFDSDGDGRVAISELMQGVNAALYGCAAPESLFGDARTWCTGDNPDWIAVGDLDADGFGDVVTINRGSDDASVRMGDGAGGLGPQQTFAVGADPRDAATMDSDGDGVSELIDVNGDGFADIVAAVRGDRGVATLLGDGRGGFGAPSFVAIAEARPFATALGDVNGDGDVDAVIASASPGLGDLRIVFGLESGAAAALFAGDEPRDVAVVDIDADGSLDLVSANLESDDISVLLGAGDGSFAPAMSFAAGDGPRRLAIGDINGDGRADIVTANQRSDDVSVLLSDQATTFAPAVQYRVGDNPRYVVVADIDGDGLMDVIAANRGSHSLTILLARADSDYLHATESIVLPRSDCSLESRNAGPRSFAVYDWNGDGRLDLVSANANSDSISIIEQR